MNNRNTINPNVVINKYMNEQLTTDKMQDVVHAWPLGGGQSMHPREITFNALELGLIRTSGRTPDATTYASVMEEIQRLGRGASRS